MPTPITIEMGGQTLEAELNDSQAAKDFLDLLPATISLSRWGDEYYGNCGISQKEGPDARDEMSVGELAIWPPGRAFCIFFGPTPASNGSEPRAASAVNPIGKLLGDVAPLKSMAASVRAEVKPA